MVGEVILVAVDASKEITDYALEWAVQNVIKSMDSLILLAIIPSRECPPVAAANHNHQTVYQFLSRLVKKRSSGQNNETGFVDDGHDMPQRIYNVCVQMIQQLFKLHKVGKVLTEVKVVAYAPVGSVAMAAAELGATWVIFDRRLKKESDCCLKQLNCNIILIDHAIPKILKSVNFPTAKKGDNRRVLSNPTVADMLGVLPTNTPDYSTVPTQSSLGSGGVNSNTDTTTTTTTTTTTSSSSSSTNKDHFFKTTPPSVTKFKLPDTSPRSNIRSFEHQVDSEVKYRSTQYSKSQPLNKMLRFDIEVPRKSTSSYVEEKTRSSNILLKSRTDINKNNAAAPSRRSVDSRHLLQKPTTPNHPRQPTTETLDRTSSIRRAMSVSIKQPPTPPPLCSVCKHNAPVFGRAPRRFSYSEIERATEGFSRNNFLAQGGYGTVYRGVLADGQVVAVKQHVMLSAQGASEFCSEVEVLSCAQHRNLVMLVGYCIEVEWLLVYEFACNGSLDKHLYGIETTGVMAWHNRMKVAIGAARGLRYLHEDCRVGCIVHRDFRPNNILLTHDFEPMVGDFGLARWQVDGQSAEETRVIGAFGYLAPEYTQTGLITEKADVYAFGVVLLELLTGIKATEFSRNAGHQYLAEWGGLSLERKECTEIIDPRLENNYKVMEVECMMHAASLCISPHPERRPRMSKVLKILEGDMPSEMVYHLGQSTSIYPRQNFNGYSTDRLQNQKLDNGSDFMQPIHRMKFSTSRQNAHKKENQKENSRFEHTSSPSSERKMVSGDWGFNQTEKLVNDDYQEYLQGSLSKYIQNLNFR